MGKHILTPMAKEAVDMLLEMKHNCENAHIYNDPLRNRKIVAIDFAIASIKYADEDLSNGSIVPM